MRTRPADPRLLLGLACLAGPLGLAALSLLWSPFATNGIDIAHRLLRPSGLHPFGTDGFGRDLLSRSMAGLRATIATALAATALGAGPGIALGIAIAASPERRATPLRRCADLIFAFPPVLTAAMLAALWGGSAIGAVVAIGAFDIPVFARVAAAAARPVLIQDFIAASRLAGRGPVGILWWHVLPNIAAPLVVQASLQAGIAVLAEAGLTYLGFGLPPPNPSLGGMLKDYQSTIGTAPWLVLIPGGLVTLLVLGCNLLGDGLRDRLER